MGSKNATSQPNTIGTQAGAAQGAGGMAAPSPGHSQQGQGMHQQNQFGMAPNQQMGVGGMTPGGFNQQPGALGAPSASPANRTLGGLFGGSEKKLESTPECPLVKIIMAFDNENVWLNLQKRPKKKRGTVGVVYETLFDFENLNQWSPLFDEGYFFT